MRKHVVHRQLMLIRNQCAERVAVASKLPRRRLDRPTPDFVIIGAAKAGTTTLLATLQQHPQIAGVAIKEPDFFSVDEMYSLGLEWYRSLFLDESADELVGEASTSYSRLPLYPSTAQRLFHSNPYAKIIYITRDPVERTYSHIIHRWSREIFPDTPFPASFTAFLDADPVPIVSSLYDQQLQPWLDRFSHKQVLRVSFEDLLASPGSETAKIFDFLGLEPICISKLEHRNSTRAAQSRAQANRWIESVKITAFGKLIRSFVPSKSVRQHLYHSCIAPVADLLVRYRNSPPPLDSRLRNDIASRLDRASAMIPRDQA